MNIEKYYKQSGNGTSETLALAEELEKFNFDHFYENYPWADLHKTSEFASHFVIHRDHVLYLEYVRYAREFGHKLP
ncbi:hypothetical protein [Algibacter pacificus]|uniref:hypothetical protein n=1 Tax=Algibacter pacificus TaxID=2599389 RepID=UPI0011CC419D|nr:hypothetical protein [Algibacter pacificus]